MITKLNKFQKYILWAFCFASAAFVVLALCYMTQYVYIGSNYNCPETKLVYPKLHLTNNLLLLFGLLLLVCFAIVCIVGNKYRKKYYISNLIAGCTVSGVGIAFGVTCMVCNIRAYNYLIANFDELYFYNCINSDGYKYLNTHWQTITNVVLAIAIIVFAVNLAFCILKYLFSKKADNSVYLD